MEQKQCDGCNHQNDCQEVYQRLSSSKEPSVLAKTVLALLLPLIIFIVTAVACEKLLANLPASQLVKVLLSILSGVIVTIAYIMIFKIATKTQRHKEK